MARWIRALSTRHWSACRNSKERGHAPYARRLTPYNPRMSTRTQLVRHLSDGKLHSGTELGRVLGVSRAAVFKAVRALGDIGVAIEAVAGRGYRLSAPLIPL